MNNLKHKFAVGLSLLMLYPMTTILAQTTKLNLLGDFKEDWKDTWIQRKLAVPPASFEVISEDDSNRVLRVVSEDGAGNIWRMLAIRPGLVGKIRWRWKIDGALSKDTNEKSKTGDDYVARVYVIFEPHLVSWRTRAICYVWAAVQPVGSVYKSPYSNSVRMIVVESGKENKREWVGEERNFVADYRKAFGSEPTMVTGVSIMVDTDNSNQFGMSYFDDLSIEVSDPIAEEARRNREIKF